MMDMEGNNPKECYLLSDPGASDEDILAFRDLMYDILGMVENGKQRIDLDLVRAHENYALHLFVLGSRVVKFLAEEGEETFDPDMSQEYFDIAQDYMSSDILSFVASHYNDAFNIFLAGNLWAASECFGMPPEEEYDPSLEQASIEKMEKLSASREKLRELHRSMMRECIDRFFEDEEHEFIVQHLPSAYILIEKGQAWWKDVASGTEQDIWEDDGEMRKSFFRSVLYDEFLQKNEIIEADRELAFILYKLGVGLAYVKTRRSQDNDDTEAS